MASVRAAILGSGLVLTALVIGMRSAVKADAPQVRTDRAASAPAEAATGETLQFAPEHVEFFEKNVRPVLVEHCYKCHSAESERLKGGLYVDGRDALIRGGDSGPSIVPGKPDESRLIEAVRYADEDTAMPPKNKLPEPAIKALEQWVAMGAPWPTGEKAAEVKKGPDYNKLKAEHWAYQPIRRTEPPDVHGSDWATTDIDRFVLSKLEAEGLAPADDADKATLLRRLCFDLTGLPPTVESLDAFCSDDSPDAYEKVVDRLLAGDQFGERWGRHWLDVARYAESLTLRGMVLSDAWRYRNYVIDTFNQDRPYDQFMVEQIAGDLLAAEDVEVRRRNRIATTYLMLGNNNLEEQDKQQLRMDVVDEQLDTFGKGMLGQTLGCARCHDHKFDPIPTADYYALAGIFRNVKGLEDANVSKWLEVPLPQPREVESQLARHEQQVAAMQVQIKNLKAVLAAAGKGPARSKSVVQADSLPGIVVDDLQARRIGEWKESQFSGNYVGSGYLQDLNALKGEKTLTFQPELKKAGKYEVRLAYVASDNRADSVQVMISSADGESTVVVNQKEQPPIDGKFISLGKFNFEDNGFGSVLVSNEGTTGFVTVDAVQFLPVGAADVNDDAAADGAKPAKRAKARPAAKAPPINPDEDTAGRLKQLEVELKKLQQTGPKRDTAISVIEESELAPMHVNVRGVVHNLGPKVERGYLTAVRVPDAPPPSATQSGRLELGAWLASKENPLPARVMANRVWHWLIGQGICRSVDNFGTTGDLPSHPELLDYLAADFQKDWSVKTLVRRIVLSHTYRLAYVGVEDVAEGSLARAAAADPENQLCWRANRRRLNGESIRDAMLAISGRLDPTPAGKTHPQGLTADYTFDYSEPKRSVYVPIFRNAMPEIIAVFDAADPSMVTGQRNSSTVAPQALFMLNHPFVKEQAAAAATRLLGENVGDDSACLELAYRRTLGRPPTAGERELMLNYVNNQEPVQAWTDVMHGLFASIDFRYVQ